METIKYVVGLAFSKDTRFVLLIVKERPDWQKGKFNGVGGKIEAGETPIDAMIREFREEAGLVTTRFDWTPLIKTIDPTPEKEWEIYFFYSFIDIDLCQTMTDEKLIQVPRKSIGILPIVNALSWIIPMALDRDFKETFDTEEMKQDYEYTALIAGGRGDMVWDKEITVRAGSLKNAATIIEKELPYDSAIVSIEQKE